MTTVLRTPYQYTKASFLSLDGSVGANTGTGGSVDLGARTALVCGEQSSAVAAVVLDVLQAADAVGNAAKAETAAECSSPQTMRC